MDRKAWRIGCRCVRTMSRNLAVRFLGGLRPAAEVVTQLVGREIPRREPGAGLEADHLKPRPCQRQGSDAADGAKPDDNDIGLLKVDGHDRPLWGCCLSG